MKLRRKSLFTGVESEMDLPITLEQLKRWQDGVFVQDAFPQLLPFPEPPRYRTRKWFAVLHKKLYPNNLIVYQMHQVLDQYVKYSKKRLALLHTSL